MFQPGNTRFLYLDFWRFSGTVGCRFQVLLDRWHIIWHIRVQTRGCSGSLEFSWVSFMVSSGYGLGYGLRNGLVRLVIGTRVGVVGLLVAGTEMLADVVSTPEPLRWPGSRLAGWTCGSASCSCWGWTAACPRSPHCSPAMDVGASGPQQSTCSPSSCAISSWSPIAPWGIYFTRSLLMDLAGKR